MPLDVRADKLIRFAFASPKRRLITLLIAGTAGLASIMGGQDQSNIQDKSNKRPDTYFSTCEEARKSGQTPLLKGKPGYRIELDRNRDGQACE